MQPEQKQDSRCSLPYADKLRAVCFAPCIRPWWPLAYLWRFEGVVCGEMYGQKEYPALVRTVVLKQEEQNMFVLLLGAGLTKASIQGRLFIFTASNLNTAVNIFTYITENPVRRLLPAMIHLWVPHHPLYWCQVPDFVKEESSLVFKQLLAVCYRYSLHQESLIGQLTCLQVKPSIF